MCCRTKLEANETHANSKWIIKQMNTIKEAGHDRLLYSVSTRPRLVMSLDFKISRSNEFASIVRVCSPASSSLYPPLIILMHTFLSCLRCRVFLNMSFKKKDKYADTVSLWAALTGRRLVSKVEHVCISWSTLWSSAVSTFLKRCSCHLTPPHDFLCSLPVCVCWPTTPLAILSSIVTHFLWTSRGMRGWPFWELRTLSVCHYRRWTSQTGPPQQFLLSLAQTALTSINRESYRKRGIAARNENKQKYHKTSWNQSVQIRQTSQLVPCSRPSGAI